MITNISIPEKSNFSSQEVCSIIAIKPYVLRFWESEFKLISPINSSSGQKIYSYEDIEVIIIIKHLLFNDKLSIEEAQPTLIKELEKYHEVKIDANLNNLVQNSSIDSVNNNTEMTELSHFENELKTQNYDDVKELLESLSLRLSEVQTVHNWL